MIQSMSANFQILLYFPALTFMSDAIYKHCAVILRSDKNGRVMQAKARADIQTLIGEELTQIRRRAGLSQQAPPAMMHFPQSLIAR